MFTDEIIQDFYDLFLASAEIHSYASKPLTAATQFSWKMKLSSTRPWRFTINFGNSLSTSRARRSLLWIASQRLFLWW